MIDHTLNVWLATRNTLERQLEFAKKHRRHDNITPIATELTKLKRKISQRLGGD